MTVQLYHFTTIAMATSNLCQRGVDSHATCTFDLCTDETCMEYGTLNYEYVEKQSVFVQTCVARVPHYMNAKP